jgi:hypothetical protein
LSMRFISFWRFLNVVVIESPCISLAQAPGSAPRDQGRSPNLGG